MRPQNRDGEAQLDARCDRLHLGGPANLRSISASIASGKHLGKRGRQSVEDGSSNPYNSALAGMSFLASLSRWKPGFHAAARHETSTAAGAGNRVGFLPFAGRPDS
jgi:hypothetical protein